MARSMRATRVLDCLASLKCSSQPRRRPGALTAGLLDTDGVLYERGDGLLRGRDIRDGAELQAQRGAGTCGSFGVSVMRGTCTW
jgi:hypothetical protein